MRVVVYTAAIGETDIVRPPRTIDPDADYLCFTDRQTVVAPYERIYVGRSAAPMLAARRIKVLAEHPRLEAADITLWHDASYALRRNLGWLRVALRDADLAALKHPRRSKLEDEALIIARYGYLTPEDALGHVARYRAAGFDRSGLTASGLLGRRRSAIVSEFNRVWWDELQQWGGRDQGSIDYAAWTAQLSVRHLPGTIRNNRLARWRIPSKPDGSVGIQ